MNWYSGVSTWNGMRVLESRYLEQDEYYTVVRTWRERLCSWPWRPWGKTRKETRKIPYQGALQINAHTVVMHPETLRKLQHGMAEGQTTFDRTNSRNPLERTPYGT